MAQGQRNLLFGGLAIVVLVLAGVFFVRGQKTTSEVPDTYSIYGVCLACKAEGQTSFAHDERAPHRCDACDEMAVYPWYYCLDCQKRFVPNLYRRDPDGPLRVPRGATCTGCGSSNVTQYIEGMYKPVGDVTPLPAWP